ncbi:hypothetical protein FACS1894181_07460 [Bacteroidia bacterium]|nr:hypothetical protein FACS1894181_07460 [Bacteroidia bacterium]
MKTLTLVPYGGLANRIYAITSSIGFCKENNVQLKIIWFKDKGIGAGFYNLLRLSSDLKNIKVVDAKWHDYRYDRPRKKNLWLPFVWQFFAFGKRIYMKDFPELISKGLSPYISCKSLYMIHCGLYYEWVDQFKSLLPERNIQTRIKEEIKAFANQRTIGVHIRRSDLPASIINSPLFLFINKIKEELKKDLQTKFFVASDSNEEKLKLKELFGDAIITSFKEIRRDTEEGIVDALTELYMLSLTEKIYGTSYSTYSTLAAQLSGIPIEILSLK